MADKTEAVGVSDKPTQPVILDVRGKPPSIPREELEPVWPGSKLDWSSPYVSIQLYVELPFWLMTPEGSFDVTHEQATLKVRIAHGCEEI